MGGQHSCAAGCASAASGPQNAAHCQLSLLRADPFFSAQTAQYEHVQPPKPPPRRTLTPYSPLPVKSAPASDTVRVSSSTLAIVSRSVRIHRRC